MLWAQTKMSSPLFLFVLHYSYSFVIVDLTHIFMLAHILIRSITNLFLEGPYISSLIIFIDPISSRTGVHHYLKHMFQFYLRFPLFGTNTVPYLRFRSQTAEPRGHWLWQV